LGCHMYAEDDRAGSFTAMKDYLDDDLSWLYPTYVSNTKSFTCPSTKNFVRPDVWATDPFTGRRYLMDLKDFVSGSRTNGHSYESFAFMGPRNPLPTIRKTQASVGNYAHVNDTFGLKGTIAGPSRNWINLDGDDFTGLPGSINDYPDKGDHHGESGANANFCDGHAEWVTVKKFLYTYEMSQDEGRATP
jgi:prepilin-type processing-associated H-X9-DG protein